MYHQFHDEGGTAYGSYEIWVAYDGNWYWWPCWPGGLPDEAPLGPFDSWDEAVIDATEEVWDAQTSESDEVYKQNGRFGKRATATQRDGTTETRQNQGSYPTSKRQKCATTVRQTVEIGEEQ